jgi:release factor glutamine methyltransferase
LSQKAVGAAWRGVRDRFRQAGIGTPELDARRLAEIAFGLDPLRLVAEERRPVEPALLEALEGLALRRLSGEPVARIVGRKEFYGLLFHLNAATLVPRPETEQLVDLALAFLQERPDAKILDLGTGTGAIPIAILANNANASAVAVDLSAEALVAARTNGALHGVAERLETRQGSWFEPIRADELFDIILSNPPYIETGVIKDLAPDVREHDPMLALDGGDDGLDAYRVIGAQAVRHLAQGGVLMVEIGSRQGGEVSQLFKNAGFNAPTIEKDLAGLDRVVLTHQFCKDLENEPKA